MNISDSPAAAMPQALESPSLAPRKIYVLQVCRVLMTYGAPTYRLEEYMHQTAKALGIHLQSFYIPGCMFLSFSAGSNWHASGVHIVRTEEALHLSKLDEVHSVYKDVIHRKISVEDASTSLDEIVKRRDPYPQWLVVLLYGLASACVGPFSYGARPPDLPIIFLLGSMLGSLQLFFAAKSRLYRHVFEISVAILTTFVARGFGSIPLAPGKDFCFSAIAQSCLVMILPGFTITNSALELQSKNMVSGAVRMVYGIIFVLFLAFGVMIGATIYGAMDSNATSATQCLTIWPFWWRIVFVGPFTFFYILINQGRWRHMPAMITFSIIGWTVNHFAAQHFQTNQQIGPTLAALAAGIFANVYSRLVRCLAYSLLYPAIFVQVPGSFAAGGSLLAGISSADSLTRSIYTSGISADNSSPLLLRAGYSMIEIAVGLTIGLSVSALVVYPIRKKKGKSGIFSF